MVCAFCQPVKSLMLCQWSSHTIALFHFFSLSSSTFPVFEALITYMQQVVINFQPHFSEIVKIILLFVLFIHMFVTFCWQRGQRMTRKLASALSSDWLVMVTATRSVPAQLFIMNPDFLEFKLVILIQQCVICDIIAVCHP